MKGDKSTFFHILLQGHRIVFKVDVPPSCTFENQNVNIVELACFCPKLTKGCCQKIKKQRI